MSAPDDRIDPGALLPWLRHLPVRPLCPVPWEGNTVVTSNGSVQLCCFSDAVVGNVNEQPFQQIWNGPQMQRIRRTLGAGALPQECRSGSCPFFRGDELHYLIDRRDGAFRDGKAAQVQSVAATRLQGSGLELPAEARQGDHITAQLTLSYQGDVERVDLFVCLTRPDGSLRFLPHDLDFPVPFCAGYTLEPPDASLTLLDEQIDAQWPAGEYSLTAALFLPDSDPNLAQHCYWATAGRLQITS